jgi:hypothetical protein
MLRASEPPRFIEPYAGRNRLPPSAQPRTPEQRSTTPAQINMTADNTRGDSQVQRHADPAGSVMLLADRCRAEQSVEDPRRIARLAGIV